MKRRLTVEEIAMGIHIHLGGVYIPIEGPIYAVNTNLLEATIQRHTLSMPWDIRTMPEYLEAVKLVGKDHIKEYAARNHQWAAYDCGPMAKLTDHIGIGPLNRLVFEEGSMNKDYLIARLTLLAADLDTYPMALKHQTIKLLADVLIQAEKDRIPLNWIPDAL